MRYLEEAVFRAVDEASRPISAINKALKQLEQTQAKLSGHDPFKGMTRELSSTKSQVESLTREYARLAREAGAAGRAIGNARPRGGATTHVERGVGGGTARGVAARDLAAVRRGTAAMIAEDEAARRASSKRVAESTGRTERLMQRQAFAERHAAEKDANKETERASRDAERETARIARQEIASQRQARRAAEREHVNADRQREARRLRFHFGRGGAGGGHGAAAHLHLPGLHGAGIGAGGLSIPGALALTATGSVVIHAAEVVMEGASEGSTARERMRQEGDSPEEMSTGRKAAEAVARQYPTTSISEALTTYAETKPFSLDENVRQFLTGQIAQSEANAIGRGGAGAGPAARSGGLNIMKSMDLAGMFRPDPKTGEVDTTRAGNMFQAINQIQGVEGRSISDKVIKNVTVGLGALATTLSPEGYKRAFLYGADVNGRAGSQPKMLDRLFSGSLGGSAGRKAQASMLEHGFMEKDPKTGRMHAVDEDQWLQNPYKWITDHMSADMKKRGFDPNNTLDVKKYSGSLKQNSTITGMTDETIVQQFETARKIAASEKARIGEKDASTLAERSISAAELALENSVKNLGTKIDDLSSGKFIPGVINTLRGGIDKIGNAITNPSLKNVGEAGKPLAEGAAGVALAGYLGSKVINLLNPLNGSAVALTGSAEALTAAAARLSAAGAVGGLGKGVAVPGAVAATGAGLLGLAVGGAAAVGGGILAYKGLEKVTDPFIKSHPQGQEYSRQLRLLKEYDNASGETRHAEPFGPFRRVVGGGRGGGSHFELGGPEVYDPSPQTLGSKFQPGTKVRGIVPQNAPPWAFGALPDRSVFDRPRASSFAGKGVESLALGIQNGVSGFKQTADGLPGKGTGFGEAAALPAKGSAFGEAAGGGILGTAGAWGSAAGGALAASIVGLKIGLDAPAKVPNTGGAPAPE